ncbi:hypothetical protein AAG570_000226 [Ranatra chinensis]|uniref:tRNA-uridine aminocarboxypropyltransferase 1 n=1 Tax=Ranatra chinensis TaxID=642074 RepID=A0ABD0ZJS1_9HEMI
METLSCDDSPFENFIISDKWKLLHSLDNRSHCSKCMKSRKYFCYTCYLPVSEIQDQVPYVKLPLKVDIIKHCREIDGKSTAAHAAVIAPNDVTIYTYPRIPNYTPDDKAVLIFPSKEATTVEELILQMKSADSESDGHEDIPFLKVVFIDSTWNQCKGIYKDSRIKSLPCVVLKSRITQFWRHQKGSPRWHLATIEAIHQFFVELNIAMTECEVETGSEDLKKDAEDTGKQLEQETNQRPHCYNGEYDNLLFFFRFMYDKIHTLYDHDTLRSYKRPLE